MKTFLINLALGVLPTIVERLSPVIREIISENAVKMYEKAKKTPNPIDDIFTAGLLTGLGIPTPRERNLTNVSGPDSEL